ncbi:class I SAM-dependent methyltransferase [Roseovarius litoreus]|jgi:ubiquinone/menaquinone biosynthesis C-methylase UbiE|uniref:class I SAM-dependent methyltransferase n=1 Tax=Roseovarius litoreus TaxID=1155722 RepID=UPI00122C72AE|nr:class I SAM-dependent methyltransferase [Roseovarius litoreus]
MGTENNQFAVRQSMNDASAAFWDRVARSYPNMSMRNPADYEKALDRIRAFLGSKDRVLELGCGTGTKTVKLVGAFGRYTTSDYSP